MLEAPQDDGVAQSIPGVYVCFVRPCLQPKHGSFNGNREPVPTGGHIDDFPDKQARVHCTQVMRGARKYGPVRYAARLLAQLPEAPPKRQRLGSISQSFLVATSAIASVSLIAFACEMLCSGQTTEREAYGRPHLRRSGETNVMLLK